MSYPLHDLVGGSPALAKVIEFIGRASRLSAAVLIEGASGTGKELAARAIHRNSARSCKPFIAVNCAALSEHVLENELFGHEPEAFTGAHTLRIGKFESAANGTLFLDEIGEIDRAIQAKLLRAVEYGEIQRVGGAAPIHVNVRLIAATNCDLRALVEHGAFREDLYYRLSVLPLRMPPLVERRQDIPLLIRRFIATSEAAAQLGVAAISPDAEALLCDYSWPGNVRQLKHVIERAAAFASGPTLDVREVAPILAELTAANARETAVFQKASHLAKRSLLEQTIQLVDGNIKKAAQILGKHPSTVSRLLDSLGLAHLKKHNRRYRTT